MSADSDVKTMQDASCAHIEVNRYEKARGTARHEDVRISRPAGIVSVRERNSGDLASFRGNELMTRKSNGR